MFLLDEVNIHKLLTEPELVKHIKANDIKLVCPEGWKNGMNLFDPAGNTKANVETILTRAKEISLNEKIPMEKAIEKAMNEPVLEALKKVGLDGKVEFLKNKNVDPSKATPGEVAKQLAPDSMTKQSLKAILDQFPPKYHQVILEVLAHELNVFSPKKMAEIAKQQQTKIEQLTKKDNKEEGIAPEDVYYFVPAGSKSYGLVTYQHMIANGISPKQIITSPEQIPKGGKEKMIVVLDDVVGSGDTLGGIYNDLRAKFVFDFKGEIVIAPTITTEVGRVYFNDMISGAKKVPKGGSEPKPVNDILHDGDPKLHFLFGEKTVSFRETEYFKSLSEPEKVLVEKLLQDKGYSEGDTLISLWYMTPNNNNAFASKFLSDFLLNGKGSRIHKDTKPFALGRVN